MFHKHLKLPNIWMWLVIEHYVSIRQNKQPEQFFRQMVSVVFNHCAHGGLRPKKTKFLCTHRHLDSLQAECPGESSEHVQLPYAIRFDGRRCNFDTALESEYPELLCKRIAQCLKDVFAQRCIFKTPTNSALSGVKQTKKTCFTYTRIAPYRQVQTC